MTPSIIFLLTIFVVSTKSQSDPTVKTDCGPIQGKILTTLTGQCDGYLGVPFAQPPIKELRFQKPQPPKCWPGTLKATEPAPRCIQMGSNGTDEKYDSEDCLYLNILVPRASPLPPKLPVMVFIHGGAFVFGSAQDYGVEGICENLVVRDVIVVVLQYRLFMYGFFSTGDKTSLGNFAIWDQIEALKWVKGNIEKFGGDPNTVTVFGESAGGASVSLLTYTPVAKDYFQQSIAESGSALAIWSVLSDASVGTAKKLAEKANCTDTDSAAYVKCLQQLSTADLQKIYNSITNYSFPAVPTKEWATRVDGELYTQTKFQEIGSKKPAIIGVNSMEMPIPDVKDIPTAIAAFNQSLDALFAGNDTMKNDVMKQLVRFVYLDSKGDRNDETFVCQQAAKIQANLMFHIGAAMEAKSKTDSGSPVWVYNFDYYFDRVFPANFPFEKGAPHAHELCYLFRMNVPPEAQAFMACPDKYVDDYNKVADHLGEMWTNFAKTGDPSPKNLVWPQFRDISNASTMTIRSELTIDPHFYLEETNFWTYLKPNLEFEFSNNEKNDTVPTQAPTGNANRKFDIFSSTFLITFSLWIFSKTIL